MGTSKGNVLDQYRCMDIYNAIESRNFSLAVKKADALLQAGPFPLASALKSYALFRLGDKEQAGQEAEKVLSQKVNLSVIMPLELVLPSLGRTQQLAELYLSASQAHPNDEELAEGALLCLVKNKMFQRALQLLLKRFRTLKEKKDFWRYIQVAVLHSQRLQPPGSKLALEVAFRLFQEQELEDTGFSEETLSLYLSFFLLQGKDRLQEALKIIEQPHCRSLVNNSLTIQFQLRECWKALEDNESVLRDCRSRIAQGDRNWAVLSECIRTMGQVANGSMNQDDVDLIIKAAEQDQWKDRGSFLGVLELFRVSHDNGLSKPCDLLFADLVRKYLVTFISKPSCFEDIRPFLAHYPEADRASLLEWAHDISDFSTESNIARKVNAAKLSRFFQSDSETARAISVSLLHDHAQALQQLDVPDTEMHPGDDLALLSAMEASATGPEALSTAAVIAIHGCQESKRAYRLRLLLIRLLLRLGCLKLAVQHYEALGLKAVQLDTVSHYVMDRNASFGGSHAADIANVWEGRMKEFYEHSAYEVPEALGRAFSNGKFSQVSDLCEFNDCLQHSCAKLVLQLDMVRSKLVNQDLVDSEYNSAQVTVQKIIDIVNGVLKHTNDQPGAPVTSVNWIKSMLEVIAPVLKLPMQEPSPTDQLTRPEGELVTFARAVNAGDNLLEALCLFLTNISSAITQSLSLFDSLHAAWIGIEGIRFLECFEEEKNINISELLKACKEPITQIVQSLSDLMSHADLKDEISKDIPQGIREDPQVPLSALTAARTASVKDVLRPYQALLRACN